MTKYCRRVQGLDEFIEYGDERDCFMMRLSIGYPDREQKIRMAAQFLSGQTPDKAEPACRTEDILKIKEAVSNITVKESLLGYIEDIVTMT